MIFEALILGFGASFHCLAMCGPLHISLMGKNKHKNQQFLDRFLFNSGRVLTYVFLGFILGYIAKSLPLYEIQKVVSILTGVIIILVYFIPKITGKELEIPFLNRLVLKAMSTFMKNDMSKSNSLKYFGMGILNGLLPCGLVYVALIASFAQLSTAHSALFMLFFGLATFPAMFFVAFMARWAKGLLTKFANLNYLTAFFVLLMGLMFIVRGSNLGIPYLSPQDLDINNVSKSRSCH